jgi:hypothetical protein
MMPAPAGLEAVQIRVIILMAVIGAASWMTVLSAIILWMTRRTTKELEEVTKAFHRTLISTMPRPNPRPARLTRQEMASRDAFDYRDDTGKGGSL